MKKIFFCVCLLASMCNRYPDNRNKDRNPDAQMESDTVVHPNARRDSAEITDPNINRSQHDSTPGGIVR
jgi:hypothetical protein